MKISTRARAHRISIAAALVVFAFSCSRERETPGMLNVETVVSTVRITAADGSAARDARPGDALAPGCLISTGPRALADLTYGKTGVVRILERASVRVDSLIESLQADIRMDSGSMIVVLDRLRKDARFRITTPTMILSVRGTGFRVTVTGNRARVDVLKGAVAVSAARQGVEAGGAPMDIGPGSFIELDDSAAKRAEDGRDFAKTGRLGGEEMEAIRATLRGIDERILSRLDPGAREEYLRVTEKGAVTADPSTRRTAPKTPSADTGAGQRDEDDRRSKERDRAGGRP
jgi:hypothetical protein